MPTYKFKKERELENKFDTTMVEMTCDTCSLDVLLESFEEFLIACGFDRDIKLENVKNDNAENEAEL